MRAIFVNHANPAIRHVSGTRLSSFADALVNRGHQVLLLTSTLSPTDTGKSPDQVARELDAWTWDRPFHVACPPEPSWALDIIRGSRVPSVFRRAMTLSQILIHGGVFQDWVRGVSPYWNLLTKGFRPQVVWGTFGNTSNLALAQKVARHAGVPWVIDVKDNWDAFVPRPLRRMTAWRFRDASGLTANSEFHARIARQWFPHRADVVYSGFPAEILGVKPDPSAEGAFRIVVVGSIRNTHILEGFLGGLVRWHNGSAGVDGAVVELIYAGADGEKFRHALAEVGWQGKATVIGYVPLNDLTSLCKSAAVNCYMWSPTTFHHKVIELLACGRPIVTYPGEDHEAMDLARAYGASFSPCRDASMLVEALDRIWGQRDARKAEGTGGGHASLDRFTWDELAVPLEKALLRVI